MRQGAWWAWRPATYSCARPPTSPSLLLPTPTPTGPPHSSTLPPLVGFNKLPIHLETLWWPLASLSLPVAAVLRFRALHHVVAVAVRRAATDNVLSICEASVHVSPDRLPRWKRRPGCRVSSARSRDHDDHVRPKGPHPCTNITKDAVLSTLTKIRDIFATVSAPFHIHFFTPKAVRSRDTKIFTKGTKG